jgi:hypothetical protein
MGRFVATEGVPWDLPHADPLGDFRSWRRLYEGTWIAEVQVEHTEGGGIVARGGLCAPLDLAYETFWAVSPPDQGDYDANPEGCWATHDACDPLDPEAEACDVPAVDALGLCAKHRAEKVDNKHREVPDGSR